ncbi:MAG TPA: hypothetical protein VFJ46_05720 [Xanthobacteraceae bacterium]|nr:hypothetical protein [Xanthobacteraceae bacterium]
MRIRRRGDHKGNWTEGLNRQTKDRIVIVRDAREINAAHAFVAIESK